MKIIVILLTLLNCILIANCDDGAPPEEMPPEDLGEKMSFSAPDMSDEEQHSSHLPKGFKCDACTAISYQVYFTES